MKKTGSGMRYRRGEIVLVKFPFTTLKQSKKRPVLIIKDENAMGDIVCFQITSKSTQSSLFLLEDHLFLENNLPLKSYVKYDKCFTLNREIVDKKLAAISNAAIEEIKKLFCDTI